MEHVFELKGSYKGGRKGKGEVHSENFSADVTIPTSMGGLDEGTNPDELLLSSSAACYFMTLGLYLEAKNISFEDIKISSKLIVSEEGRVHVESIHHYPVVYLNETPDESLRKRILDIADRAEDGCMITRAIKGNVNVFVEPSIEIV
ncbi:OsmC family protein [Guptibacillus algicola]|uniref:OsmC family protein n=1 Tax=Guptibacillus algicola TaxID=225844 RepID=UPI001CD4CF83|nr:OsmC family protein [Alkalihalobacillus algicola]MCA0988215.1 OsmC family protein [Alkalihalobacillus algicola]